MSKLEIEIPDDRWFQGEWKFRPQDRQLCVVIFIDGGVRILQYRKDEKHGQQEILHSLSLPTYFTWNIVDRWKPLGLPADVNERILAEIEKRVEEDEE